MTDDELLERIGFDSEVMIGKPVIRGNLLTVEYVVNLLAHGASAEEILDEYQGLTREDIQACCCLPHKPNNEGEVARVED